MEIENMSLINELIAAKAEVERLKAEINSSVWSRKKPSIKLLQKHKQSLNLYQNRWLLSLRQSQAI